MIEGIDEKELMSDPWFSKPDVVSGPYKLTDFDRDHYVSYEPMSLRGTGAPKGS